MSLLCIGSCFSLSPLQLHALHRNHGFSAQPKIRLQHKARGVSCNMHNDMHSLHGGWLNEDDQLVTSGLDLDLVQFRLLSLNVRPLECPNLYL